MSLPKQSCTSCKLKFIMPILNDYSTGRILQYHSRKELHRNLVKYWAHCKNDHIACHLTSIQRSAERQVLKMKGAYPSKIIIGNATNFVMPKMMSLQSQALTAILRGLIEGLGMSYLSLCLTSQCSNNQPFQDVKQHRRRVANSFVSTSRL